MRKALKITVWILALVALLLFGAAIMLQTRQVQTLLARRAVEMLADRFDADIRIERIHVRLLDAVVLQDVTVMDPHPYDLANPVDTFFHARSISATFSVLGLLRKEGIHIGHARVTDAVMNLTIEQNPPTNLNRLFGLTAQPKPYTPDDTPIFDIARVDVDGMTFRMRNYMHPMTVGPGAINWSDLDVRDIRVRGRKMAMRGHVMTGIADEVSFRERSGYRTCKISGDVKAGDGRTVIRDLKITDPWSQLDLPLFQMIYAPGKGFGYFLDDVTFDATIRPSTLDFKTLGYFAEALQPMDILARFQGKVHGPVSALGIRGIRVEEQRSGFRGLVDGSLTGLPDAAGMVLDAHLSESTFTLEELSDFIRGLVPSVDLPLGRLAYKDPVRFDGTVLGTLNDMAVKGKVNTLAGDAEADIRLRHILDRSIPLTIGGALQTRDLDVGRFLDIDQVGPCTLRARLQASLESGAPSVRIDSLRVDRLNALDYDYTGIAATGTYSGKAFDGKLICADPNLNFLFQGIFNLSPKTRNALYQFYANLGYADLHALHLDPRPVSRISFQTLANFKRVDSKDLIGNIDVKDLRLVDEGGTHPVGDIAISSHISDELSRIRLNSAFAEGSYVGSRFLSDFISDLQDLTLRRELPAAFGAPAGGSDGNHYSLSFLTRDTRDLLTFFMPGLYLADSTAIRLDVRRDGSLSGSVRSRRIAIKDKYIKGLDLSLTGGQDGLRGSLTGDEFSLQPILTLGNRLTAYAHQDQLGVGLSYDNRTDPANKGEFNLSGSLERTPEDSLVLHADILPSNLYFSGEPWSFSPARLRICGDRIRVEDFRMASSDQSIRLEGGYCSSAADTLRLSLDRFDLGVLNLVAGGDLDIQGLATGQALLASPLKERISILLGMSVDGAGIGGQPLGTLGVSSAWDAEHKGFDLLAYNILDGKRTFSAKGLIVPSDGTIDALARLDGFNLGYARPLLKEIFSDLGGRATGEIRLQGKTDRPEIISDGLLLEDGLLKIAFTNVPYNVSGPVRIGNDGVFFDQVRVTDRFGASGRVSGSIAWDHFRDIRMDTHIRVREMEAIDMPEHYNPIFYGNAFATGQVDITGPLNALKLEVRGATAKEGSFHLPLGGTSTAGTSDLLTFKQEETPVETDPYEEMIGRITREKTGGSGLSVHLDLDVNTQTQALIELNKETGNILSGRGTGHIDLVVDQNGFSLGGNYDISSGNYHLDVLNLARKDFAIQEGSSIRFRGDVMESDLDIHALYKTKAAIGTLIADTTATARRTVECSINITDKLRAPRVEFGLNIPDLDPATQGLVESALSTTDKVQKQFLSLLISGSFLPDEQSGIVNNTTMLNTTISEIMSGQLNDILQKFNIPVDFGLGYQLEESGRSVYDVAVSTQLFNNRVLVNGTIGNRTKTTAAGGEVVGDLDIEIKLDKRGALRLKLFSHSADQYTSFLDDSQRNGVGLSYQREFNTFREFFRTLFRSRERRQEEDAGRLRSLRREDQVRLGINREDLEDDE